MKPQDIVTAIKKRWWVIVVLTLIAALTGTLMARFKSPVYKVEAQMAATAPKSVTTGSIDATIQLSMSLVMPTVANATESIKIAEATRQRLLKTGIDIPAETLLDKVSANAVPNSNGLKISVTDTSPTRVADIANAWAAESSAILSNDPILLGGTLELTNAAVPPKKPTQPKPMVYLGLGVFLGLVLGFTIVIGWEYFDPHFRSEEETEEMLGLPVLGTLPKKSSSHATSSELYSRLRASLLFSLNGKESTSVAVAAAVPDSSGQSIAINLAKSIANSGGKTLLVDCDMRTRSASELMGAGEVSGLAEVLEKGEPFNEKVGPTSVLNLYMLPAGHASVSPSDLLSSQRFAEVTKALEGGFEWVVFSVPALTTAVDAALVVSRAQSALVVIDAETCTRNTALDALRNLRRLQLEPSGVVLTNVKTRRRERNHERG